MNFPQILRILIARRKIIIGTFLSIVLAVLAFSLFFPKTYKATTTLVLNYKGADPVTGITVPAQLMPGYMATQVDIIKSPNVALKVVDELKLAEGPAVQEQFIDDTEGKGSIRDWLARLLLKKLEVMPSRESSVLDISFKGADPQFAALVANAFAAAYQQTSIQLRAEPSQRASGYFNSQIKVLRERLEKAQNKLSAYQQEHGIVSADNRLDVESARLNDLSSQLVAAQAQAMEAASRQRQAQSANGVSPDVLANPLIQNLKASLSAAEAKFAEISQKLEKNHPQYQAAQSEVEKLRSNLNDQTRMTAGGVAGTAKILQQREAELRSAVAAQKAKVIELNNARDELKVLTNEMEAAQRAYEAASQRLTQTSMEAQFNQSDIAVLNPAVAPIEPHSPRLLLNTLASIVLGTVLGLAAGIMAEVFDRRIRSHEDIAEVLHAPVLGVIRWEKPRKRGGVLSRMFFSRFATSR